MILKKIVPCPPPSIMTDSDRESGRLRKKFRKKNVCPQTLVATYTRIRPARVPIRPFVRPGSGMPFKIRNCGMMFRKPGIISVNR